jgi:FAD/FMN-containing dehydrogenase
MKISRRRFLERTISGAALVATGQLSVFATDKNVHIKGVRAADDTSLPEPKVVVPEAPKIVIPESPKVPMPELSREFLEALKRLKIQGKITAPGEPDYAEASKDYNGRFSSHPNCVIYCESEADVIDTVKWAKKQDVPVSLRSGGHSYEGFSIADSAIVIDVSKMANIRVNAAKKIVHAESGTTLMPLYEALWQKRLVVPGGSCATVGLAGLALGGGFGLLARSMGLTCDNILGVRMVDASGNIIEANEQKNTDLLWACRGGGGGSFGVVTEFTLQAHSINNVSIFKLKWNWNDMPSVIKAWQKWAPLVDDRMTSVLTLTSKKSNRVSCIGLFNGGQAEVHSLIKPLIAAAKPTKISLTTSPFIDAVNRFSGVQKPKGPLSDKAVPDTVHQHIHPRFKNSSDYVTRELDDDGIKTIVTHLAESPRDSSCIQFDSYGGKINRVPIEDSAFCHRGDTKFCIHYQISWQNPAEDERNVKWVYDFKKAMRSHVSGFSYFNYCDRETDNWAHSYYGDNLERLVAVKNKFDPDNFFKFAQSIPTSIP